MKLQFWREERMTTQRSKPEKRPLPKHLTTASRRWAKEVLSDYALEAHHLKVLVLCCEARDRCEQARAALAKHGVTFVNRHGEPHVRPEVAIERDARLAFWKLLRALDLDAEAPALAIARSPVSDATRLRRLP